MKSLSLPIAAVSLLYAPAAFSQEASHTVSARAPIVADGGAQIGEVLLTDGPAGVLIRISARGLTPGWHAMHFHAVGDCSDQGFQKSGAHINHAVDKKPHGLLNANGPDFGDLPNIFASPDGSVNAEAYSPLVKLGAGTERADLVDTDGSALVIHASADDHVTQPIGGAGARVACALIRHK